MNEKYVGMNEILEMVALTAEELGIDSTLLVFQWEDQDGMVLPEHGIPIKDRICVLKIFLGNSYQALTFTESIVQDCVRKPETLTTALSKSITAAVKKLKQGAPT